VNEIENRLVLNVLPAKNIAVRRRDGFLMLSGLYYHQAKDLAESKLVNAAVTKQGDFKHLILTGAKAAMHRVLNKTARTGRSIAAEDNYTVRKVLVHLPNGRSAHYFEPDYRRANAYRGTRSQ
jgi:hypothetical protein